jgi:hypothetical protein
MCTITLRGMDGAIARLRWRRRGAWLWPAFALLTLVDAVIGHLLPPAGQTQTLIGAALVACFFNLIGILLLSRPVGALIRKRRPDLPAIVARDYAGTAVIACITAAILLVGIVHRHTVLANVRSMQDATARAQAWIGDRAPAPFRRNLASVTIFTIEAGSIYRACVPDAQRTRTYCVIVNTRLPFGNSVKFDGYEPNSLFAVGVN